MPAFDVAAARKAGYSDDEILKHLAGSKKFDLAGAMKSGYSAPEILDHLTKPAEAPAGPEKRGLFGSLYDGTVGGLINGLRDYVVNGSPTAQGLRAASRGLELLDKQDGGKLSADEKKELDGLQLPTPAGFETPLSQHPIAGYGVRAAQQIQEGDVPGAVGTVLSLPAMALAAKVAPKIASAAPLARDAVVAGVKAAAPDVAAGALKAASGSAISAVAHMVPGGGEASYLLGGVPVYKGVTQMGRGIKAGALAARDAVAEGRAVRMATGPRKPVWQGAQPQAVPEPVPTELPPAALPSGRVPGRFDPENPPVADWRERLQQLGVNAEAQPLASVPPVEATPAPAPDPAPIVAPQPEPAPVIPPKAATRATVELPNPTPVKTPKVVTGNEFETAARYAKAQALAKFLYAEGDGVPHESALKMDPKQWALAQKGAGVAGPPSPKTIKMALDELKKLEVSQPIARQMAAEVNAQSGPNASILPEEQAATPQADTAKLKYLFHGTSSKYLPSIEQNGLTTRSNWQPGKGSSSGKIYLSPFPEIAGDEAWGTVNGDYATETEGVGGEPSLVVIDRSKLRGYGITRDPELSQHPMDIGGLYTDMDIPNDAIVSTHKGQAKVEAAAAAYAKDRRVALAAWKSGRGSKP